MASNENSFVDMSSNGECKVDGGGDHSNGSIIKDEGDVIGFKWVIVIFTLKFSELRI